MDKLIARSGLGNVGAVGKEGNVDSALVEGAFGLSDATCGRLVNLSGSAVVADDDDELIVRASAVLKSQGPENWSRGRPGLRWARTNSRSARDASCGKIRGKPQGG